MDLPTALLERLRGTEAYECVLCANRFERERRSCPACGSTRIEPVS